MSGGLCLCICISAFIFHSHAQRWFLYPPRQMPTFHPNVTTLQWLMNEYSDLSAANQPYECTIQPGEVGSEKMVTGKRETRLFKKYLVHDVVVLLTR